MYIYIGLYRYMCMCIYAITFYISGCKTDGCQLRSVSTPSAPVPLVAVAAYTTRATIDFMRKDAQFFYQILTNMMPDAIWCLFEINMNVSNECFNVSFEKNDCNFIKFRWLRSLLGKMSYEFSVSPVHPFAASVTDENSSFKGRIL